MSVDFSPKPRAFTPRQTQLRIDVLIDVRSPEEYAEGCLPGARNIPVQELAARLDELGSRQALVAVYCRSGRRSAAAEALLRASGFERVIDLGSLEQAAAANGR